MSCFAVNGYRRKRFHFELAILSLICSPHGAVHKVVDYTFLIPTLFPRPQCSALSIDIMLSDFAANVWSKQRFLNLPSRHFDLFGEQRPVQLVGLRLHCKRLPVQSVRGSVWENGSRRLWPRTSTAFHWAIGILSAKQSRTADPIHWLTGFWERGSGDILWWARFLVSLYGVWIRWFWGSVRGWFWEDLADQRVGEWNEEKWDEEEFNGPYHRRTVWIQIDADCIGRVCDGRCPFCSSFDSMRSKLFEIARRTHSAAHFGHQSADILRNDDRRSLWCWKCLVALFVHYLYGDHLTLTLLFQIQLHSSRIILCRKNVPSLFCL